MVSADTTADRAGLAGTAPAQASPAVRASAWLAVASIAVGSFSTVTTEFLPIGLLPTIADGLGVSQGLAGLMVTMPGVVAALAGPALIVASGRLDRRSVLIALTVMLLISNVLAALAPNFATMLVARVFLGLSVGGFWTFAPGATAFLVPPAQQARAISYVLAGVSVATVAGVPAGSLLGNVAGWRAVFGVAAVLSAVVLAVQVWLLPAMPPARATQARDLLKPFANRGARNALLVTLFMIAGHFAAYTYLTPLLGQTFGLSAEVVTGLLLVYGASGFLGTFVGGRVATRSAQGAALLAAVLVAAVLLFAALTSGGLVAGVVVAFVWGSAFGIIPVALTTWMQTSLPEAPEAGQALLVTGFQVAIASGALFGGRLVDGLGIPSAMVLGSVLAVVAAAVIAAALRR